MSRSKSWRWRPFFRGFARPSAGLFAATALLGCLDFAPYQCETDDQCDARDLGRCEAVGFCSYPDADCVDTGHRFDASAGDGLGGECVGPQVAGTDTEDPTTGSMTSTDPTLDSGDSTGDSASDSSDGTTGGSESGTMGEECGAGGQPCCDDGSECDPGLTCQQGLCGCVTAVEVGDRHSCAIKTDGSVVCWGANDQGQLGSIKPAMSSTPVDVPGAGSSVTALSARLQTCAMEADGQVQCWGGNGSGQAAPASAEPVITMAIAAPVMGTITRIGAGGGHTCAATGADSPIHCWGSNSAGQLTGKGAPGPNLATMPAPFEPSIVALGDTHTCVAALTGALLCWGNNNAGQLATDPTLTPSTSTPSQIAIDPVGTLTAGGSHTCARVGTELQCWGLNGNGQLGNASTANSSTPVSVMFAPGTAPIASVAAADNHTCAVLTTGEVQCWGANERGEISLVIDKAGDDSFSLIPRETKIDFPVAQLATGTTHSCGLSTDGQLYCWGANDFGQLGDGTTTDASTPRQVQIDCP